MANRPHQNNEPRTGTAIGDYNARNTKTGKSLAELRRNIVAECLRKNMPYAAIRLEVMARLDLKSCAMGTICYDVKKLLAEWREERLDDTEALVTLELARIDKVVGEAWASWDKSKEDYRKEKAKQEGVPGASVGVEGVVVTKLTQEKEEVKACGDPRYLSVIDTQLKERRKLLGLYAPEKSIVASDLSFANLLMQTGKKGPEANDDKDTNI